MDRLTNNRLVPFGLFLNYFYGWALVAKLSTSVYDAPKICEVRRVSVGDGCLPVISYKGPCFPFLSHPIFLLPNG